MLDINLIALRIVHSTVKLYSIIKIGIHAFLRLIDLFPQDEVHNKAIEWINCFAPNKTIVSVHLKNNHLDTRSNADPQAWARFFKYCETKFPLVKFVLIGNDLISSDILQRSNVVATSMHEGNLILDFAIISNSFLFMGMSSGPCNFAIMSNKPYLIWKHPGHHTKEMEIEFSGHQQFLFAKQTQKFFIDWDTQQNLSNQFNIMYSKLCRIACFSG